MPVFALTIFSSAFLLFLVQPLIAKQILPWFGGAASVWTTCLLFFQCALVAGYAYAHWMSRRFSTRTQIVVHALLLAASLAWLPAIPGAAWQPSTGERPAWHILGLLSSTIGLPYLLLSATNPLVQSWFARLYPQRAVYRLFALSNLGSLLALVAYPILVEPLISTRHQSWIWGAGYIAFAASCIATAWLAAQAPAQEPHTVTAAGTSRPAWRRRVLWLTLSALGSMMLLAVTNHITQNVASVPFLWIAPLSLYLVTFILCFEGRNWYRRSWFLAPLAIAAVAMAWALHGGSLDYVFGTMGVVRLALGLHPFGTIIPVIVAAPLYCAGLFVCCMFYHGELAHLRPSREHLTTFYLMVSAGGALGGALVAVVAPLLLSAHYELGFGLLATGVLAVVLVERTSWWLTLAAACVTVVIASNVYGYVDQLWHDVRYMTRSFYGSLRVRDSLDPGSPYASRQLVHGVILHGEQYLADDKRRRPTSYYGPHSGVGLTLGYFADHPIRVGVIGLGTGTLAAWSRHGDAYRFYELDSDVEHVARDYFSFLREAQGTVSTVVGDARLRLETEAPQGFDVLAIDAFSGDSIPVHLLTREALSVYLRHMKPTGVVAFHVTNRYLRLASVVERIATERGLHAVLISRTTEDEALDAGDITYARSDWMLVTANDAFAREARANRAFRPTASGAAGPTWTDDFSNLLSILK